MPGENETRTNQEVTDLKQGNPSRRTTIWGWGAKQKIKKKNLSFPETDNQEGCKGTRGEGVSLHTEPGKGLKPGIDQRAPHPHTVTTNNSKGQNGQANGRVSGKRVAVGSVVQAPQG